MRRTTERRASGADRGRLETLALKTLAGVLVLAAGLSCGGSDVPTGPSEDPVPTMVMLSANNVTLTSIGESVQLQATVLDQSGAVLSGTLVVWSSSDVLVAAVSSAGLVTAVGNGTVSIAAAAGVAADTASVTVTQIPDTLTVVPNPIVLNGPGDTLRAEATVRDAAGFAVPGQVVTWSSSDESVATVDAAGLVLAVSTGTTSITAAAGSLATVVGVTVTQTPAFITVSPTSVSFVSLGDTATVEAVVLDATNSEIQGAAVVWSTSDPAVVTVTGGLLTSVGTGTAALTAAAGPVSATVTVSVVQVASYVTISPDPIALNGPGDTLRAVGTVRDAGGSAISGETVVWSSGDATVATVSTDGLITAVGEGATMISASSGQLSASVNAMVTVTPASITLSPDSVLLASLGDTVTIVAAVRDANGNVISGTAVAWSSSDPAVATVNGGLVTAIAFGSVTIAATAGSVATSAVVVVQASTPAPSFSQVVTEIFGRRGCTAGNCHGGGSGGMTLTSSAATNYANLVNVQSQGDPAFLRVKPNDALNSYLIMKLEGRAGARMPIGGAPLNATDLGNIRDWINAGAPNN